MNAQDPGQDRHMILRESSDNWLQITIFSRRYETGEYEQRTIRLSPDEQVTLRNHLESE